MFAFVFPRLPLPLPLMDGLEQLVPGRGCVWFAYVPLPLPRPLPRDGATNSYDSVVEPPLYTKEVEL